MQIRLTKENLIALNSIGISTQKDVNDWIRDTLLGEADVKQMGSNQPQLDLSSLLPFLSSIEESLAVMACASGRVGQRTLNGSSEQLPEGMKRGVFNLDKGKIKLSEDQSIEEQYGRPKKPNQRPLSERQQQRVNDLFNKTMGGISPDGDWESSSGATRNVGLVYESLKGPADLYDQYVRIMQEWLLDNWEDKAELFKF